MRRRLVLLGWQRLSDALAATSKGYERLRYSEPDLEDSASAVFDAVLSLHDLAIRGETDDLEPKVAAVNAAAAALRVRATAPAPPPD
jgi:hypothetical protein